MASIDRYNRWARESQMSTEDLLEWAEEEYANTGRWPTRRYRIVNSYGKSRLLTQSVAEREQRKYGGSIEESIPKRKLARPKRGHANDFDPLRDAGRDK